MNNNEMLKDILKMIKQNKISPREGLRKINEIKKNQLLVGQHNESNTNDVESKVKDIICKTLKMDKYDLSIDISFKEMGVDSISSVEIVRDLNNVFNINMDGIQLYDYPTIPALTKSILEEINKNNVNVIANKVVEKESNVDNKRLNHRYEYMNDLIDKFSKNQPSPVEESARVKQEIQFNTVGKVEDSKKRSHTSYTKPLSLKILSKDKDNNAEEETVNKRKGKIVLSVFSKNSSSDNSSSKVKLNIKSKEIKEKAYTKIEPIINTEVSRGIAIIGMSGRFPGADNTRQLWKNIRDGVCSISDIPKERFDIDSFYDENRKADQKTYCKVAGLIDNIDEFDPLFFNISPKEAEIIDPQQRIFLEEAWKAIEDAGYSNSTIKNTSCGVFVGCAPSDYIKNLEANMLNNTAEAFIGASSSILAARISYCLNLKGPSISIDTACSSSLVAVHQACASLWNGECDMALAGGIRLMFTPNIIVQSSQMEILSTEGVCRPFDESADGTLLSEGVGVIVLKSLEKAIEDRDYIYGVIKGVGLNQDGKTNGITAPSAISQTNLAKDVYKKFNINPKDISYIETHGTGTKLGDPIEVKALTEAFREFTNNKNYCALGSIKANIGHTTMAAGVISIIKVLLAIKNKKIPPLINFNSLNEKINLGESPFYINTDLINWPENKDHPRMAAISGFGFSGTNCHIVIEEFN
ncbi:phosphopantetheine-binding protein [Clostridium estertheticum]|uniref:beta-ketoacyl synthase N-terminal-like domain-containing protein n=1 Tax=Clostridium estertheticum TaxID=238834 RepID=UPI0013EED9C5|nr:beta-ketoacyl synthase N-terminal-like domain-containing protein [Clostridium estertheticum]MBZ9609087.1 phosphopantetheine-binding protein [Clostridium estertheticum]